MPASSGAQVASKLDGQALRYHCGMAKKDPAPKPAVDLDELIASTDFRELFRYRRGDTVETYNLRPLSDSKAELWVVTTHTGESTASSHLETTFTTVDEAIRYLDAKEQSLQKSRWKRLPDGRAEA